MPVPPLMTLHWLAIAAVRFFAYLALVRSSTLKIGQPMADAALVTSLLASFIPPCFIVILCLQGLVPAAAGVVTFLELVLTLATELVPALAPIPSWAPVFVLAAFELVENVAHETTTSFRLFQGEPNSFSILLLLYRFIYSNHKCRGKQSACALAPLRK